MLLESMMLLGFLRKTYHKAKHAYCHAGMIVSHF